MTGIAICLMWSLPQMPCHLQSASALSLEASSTKIISRIKLILLFAGRESQLLPSPAFLHGLIATEGQSAGSAQLPDGAAGATVPVPGNGVPMVHLPGITNMNELSAASGIPVHLLSMPQLQYLALQRVYQLQQAAATGGQVPLPAMVPTQFMQQHLPTMIPTGVTPQLMQPVAPVAATQPGAPQPTVEALSAAPTPSPKPNSASKTKKEKKDLPPKPAPKPRDDTDPGGKWHTHTAMGWLTSRASTGALHPINLYKHTHSPMAPLPAGKLVWAKVGSIPWWPAKTLDPARDASYPPDADPPRPTSIPIRFFGTHEFFWIGSKRQLVDWEEVRCFLLMPDLSKL